MFFFVLFVSDAGKPDFYNTFFVKASQNSRDLSQNF